MTPILMLGCGRMGGALVKGLLDARAIDAADLMLRDPMPGADAQAAVGAGARLNPPDSSLGAAKTVVLAVKPQMWREVAHSISGALSPDAAIVSIAAGVRLSDVQAAFAGRSAARVMPTTAVAIGKGVASIYAAHAAARSRAHELFDPVARTVDLEDEALMDAATAVSGSGPAYLYAFIEALEAAAQAEGLDADAARVLARNTITSAAALMAASGEEPAELRRQVTSPGGTTEAALKVLQGEGGLPALMREAVAAAVRRSRELGV